MVMLHLTCPLVQIQLITCSLRAFRHVGDLVTARAGERMHLSQLDHTKEVVMIFSIVVLAPDRYLDPGSGSYIFQLIIAVLVGALFLIKVYWRRIRALFAGWFSRDNKDET